MVFNIQYYERDKTFIFKLTKKTCLPRFTCICIKSVYAHMILKPSVYCRDLNICLKINFLIVIFYSYVWVSSQSYI